MKKTIFYAFIILTVVGILVRGIIDIFNLAALGIATTIFTENKQKGQISLWKLIMGLTIVLCGIILGVTRIIRS